MGNHEKWSGAGYGKGFRGRERFCDGEGWVGL